MMPNHRAGVDAGRPLLFAFGRRRPGTTHHGRWVRVAMRLALLVSALLAAVPTSRADTLTTPSYTITIKGCEEYVVSCDNVKYVGLSNKTGKSVTLTGRTVHSVGADGVTPAHFLGYVFKKGKTTYFVGEDGELKVTRGSRVLVQERGVWDWEHPTRRLQATAR